MAQDFFGYPKMVETALRNVVREALARTAREGLPGDHHFFITFRTRAAGVVMPKSLIGEYPDEMTVVLQHQFRALEVADDSFSVNLSFQSRSERLTIPFAAVTTFADPSVKFGLQVRGSRRRGAERGNRSSRADPRVRALRGGSRAAGRRGRHARQVSQALSSHPQTPAKTGRLRENRVRGAPARARVTSLVQRRRVSRAWRMTLPTVLSSKKRSRLGLAV